MARLEIGKKIAALRKQKNLTQEQLAGIVGVSAGAVSKWETGSSVPDIALLSPLARALHTTLDDLLSFQRALSKEEIAGIKQQLTQRFLQEGYASGKKKSLSYLREYPNSVLLKLAVAGLLSMYCRLEEERGEAACKEEKELILTMYREILSSGHAGSRAPALFCMADLLLSLDRYEECEQAIQEISQSSIDPMTLYIQLLQKQARDEEAQIFCQQMLLQYLSQSAAMLSILMRLSEKTGREEEADRYLNAVRELQDRFGIGLGSACFHVCRRRLAEGNKEEAAQAFLSYIQAVTQTGYDYAQNPFFNRVKLEIEPLSQKMMRRKMLASIREEELPELQSLAGIPAYEQGLGLLEASLSE